MRARDLAQDLPTVSPDTELLEAARQLATHRLPGLLVVDDDRRPLAVIPASQLLGLAVPRYVRDDPSLAGVLDESVADSIGERLAGVAMHDLLEDDDPDLLPVVEAHATLLEVAALMARDHTPLVAVVDGGRVVGAVTVHSVVERLLVARGDSQA